MKINSQEKVKKQRNESNDKQFQNRDKKGIYSSKEEKEIPRESEDTKSSTMKRKIVTLNFAMSMELIYLHYFYASWALAAYHLHPHLQKAAGDHLLWIEIQITNIKVDINILTFHNEKESILYNE